VAVYCETRKERQGKGIELNLNILYLNSSVAGLWTSICISEHGKKASPGDAPDKWRKSEL
jgi:hypothetical protein